jgi:hypothetical protein
MMTLYIGARFVVQVLLPGEMNFNFLPAKETDLGSTEIVNDKAHVTIHPSTFTTVQPRNMPTGYTYGHITEVAMGRLNTLLHEVIHAFIAMYVGRRCPSYDEHVEHLDGHGLVW